MHTEINPRPARPRSATRSRWFGRMLVTLTLLGGVAGGWWAVSAGKRLAKERKERMLAPPVAPVR